MDDQNTEAEAGRLIRRAIDVTPEADAMAREALGELAEDLSPDLLRDAQLLASDVIRHRVQGRPPTPAGTIGLDISLTDARVRVQIADDDAAVPAAAGWDEPLPGWRLGLVAELADRWGITRNRFTTVWFELDR